MNNIQNCPHYESCNQAMCLLDLNLNNQPVEESAKCRWMREPKLKKINGREFVAGGTVAPDGVLNFAPQANIKWLNASSKKRKAELEKLTKSSNKLETGESPPKS